MAGLRGRIGTVAAALALVGAGTAGIALGDGPPTLSPAAQRLSSLTRDLDAILADPGAAGSQSAVVVRDSSGNVLYSRNPDERLMPASNAKLFTSTAALDLLGPDFRFTTSVLADGARHGVARDLYLRGGGDPTTLAADYDALAAKVAATGVRIVTGGLVADDSYFDDVRLGTGWSWDDEPYYYNAQISALTVAPNTDYDSGTVIVESRPGARAGDPARLTLVPDTGVVHLVNKAGTAASGADNTISVDRTHGDSNTIVVTGDIPLGSAVDQEWSTVWDPTSYAADVFRRALASHGVRVLGATRYAPTPTGAAVVAEHQSMDLADMYIPFLKLSNNMHAEALVKTMGEKVSGQGSWDAGIAAEEGDLTKLGVNTKVMQLVDGSGLSRMELVTGQQISNVLVAAQHQPWFSTWYDALPISAQPARFVGGTLRNRMVGTPAAGKVHAKTGSLTGVTSLSGYVTDAAGQRLIFSVMQNNLVGFDGEQIEDKIAIRLAEYGGPDNGVPALPKTNYGPAGIECSWAKAC